MEILIVSNYYPPEKGAAANRIEQLAISLREHGFNVGVVCPLANYPEGKLFDGYRGRFSKTEILSGIRVRRLWIYPSNSKNPFKRVLSTFSFASCLFFYLLFGKIPKKVVVQSPPLLLSFISVCALKLRRRKIILNVSDLWPSAAIELGALKPGSLSHKLLLYMEKRIYRNASVVLAQSDEIIAHVRTIIPDKECHLYRNLPSHKELIAIEKTGPLRIFYAGLLGVAQGVYECCLKMELPQNVEFHIFGDGAEKQLIEEYIKQNSNSGIHFHGMVPRNILHEKLKEFDVAFVPLKTRIYGSVPSKIFEYSLLGIPLLYFGGGEGEDIVRDFNLGRVVPVEDYVALNVSLLELSKLSDEEIREMKQQVFENAGREFDLERQMREIIAASVF